MMLYNLTDWAARKLGVRSPQPSIDSFAVPTTEASRFASESSSDLAKLFYGNTGRTVHKWTHYIDAYDKHFAPYRGKAIRMLELGVFQGGSLDLWRRYFGDQATIYGVDVNPDCRNRVDPPNQVRIGSQADPAFLRSVVAEMGGIDIVLDDGSHVAEHQKVSFETLFPVLNDGGVYAIEDLHTAYWPQGFDGGYQRPGTAIELIKQMIDDMHSSYHDRGERAGGGDAIASLHIYDSITFIDKRAKREPCHIQIGPQAV